MKDHKIVQIATGQTSSNGLMRLYLYSNGEVFCQCESDGGWWQDNDLPTDIESMIRVPKKALQELIETYSDVEDLREDEVDMINIFKRILGQKPLEKCDYDL